MNQILRSRIRELYDTQADFAQTIGVDESLVSRVVRGRRQLDPDDQNKWALLLNCRPEKLFDQR